MDQATYRAIEQLVWTGNWRALCEQPVTPHYSWVNACQTDAIRFRGDTDAPVPADPAPAYPGAAVVMMVKDEEDVLPENLCWNYRCGVRRFVIMDNASTDGTWAAIAHFRDTHPQAEVMAIYDPIVRHIQAEKTTGMLRMVCAWWPDVRWVIPVDADEFPIPAYGLSLLDAVDTAADAVVVQKAIHFRRTGDADSPVDRPVAQMPIRSELFVVPPKVIVRADPMMSITQGNHDAQRPDRETRFIGGFGLGLYYREFPNRSLDHLERKVVNGARAIRAAHLELGRDVGGHHWLAMNDVLEQQGRAGLADTYERDFKRVEGHGYRADPFIPLRD